LAPLHSWNARLWLERRIFSWPHRGPSSQGKRTRRATKRTDRIRFSAISSPRRSDRLRKSRDPALVSESEQERTRGDCRRHTRPFSNRREKGFVPKPAIWRTTTVGWCSARDHFQSEAAPRRRADWKSSFQPGRRNHEFVQKIKCRWDNHRAGDTFRKKRQLRKPRHPTPRRLDCGR